MEQRYCLRLDDYSAPFCASWDKPYYGTLADVQGLVDALANDGKDHGLSIVELIDAYRAYIAGDHDVTHYVAYRLVPLLETVHLLGSESLSQDSYTWNHENVWDCTYTMRCDSVKVDLYWISGSDGFCRVVKASFDNLTYKGDAGIWHPLRDGYWGFPEIFASDGDSQSIRLAVLDKRFESMEDALKDMTASRTLSDVNFERICDDVFGNG